MGQNICRCVKADSVDDSVYEATQSTPARSTANSRDCLPPPGGSSDGHGSAKSDGVKKRRFWKWMKGRKAGQSASEVAVVPADSSTAGERSVQQETLVSEPDGGGSSNRDGVKRKKRFWKWRKDRKAPQSATEVAVVPADNSTEDEISVQQVHVAVLPSLGCSVPISSEDNLHTAVLFHTDLLVSHPQSPVRSVSDSSEDSFPTPALSLADLLVSHPQSPVRSVSDSSEDSFHTPILSLADLLVGNPQSLVRPVSDPSIDSIQTPVQSGSDSRDVSQPSVSSEVSLKDFDLNVAAENIEEVNSCKYEIGRKLGQGGYGTVYKGTRVSDGLKVAVKFVKKSLATDYISIPCHPEPLPREIALLILATNGSPVPEIIKLLDWEDKSNHYVMVLECPSPCQDLQTFVRRKGGTVTEGLAQIIMWQATIAASVCFERGVFHRDIKLDNLLINTDTLDVKLIDFGCGDILKTSEYKMFVGALEYCCPEYYEKFQYHAEPATVWSLGVSLFAMLCGLYPGFRILDQMKNNKWSKRGLSKECCSLIQSCLQEDPNQRFSLKDVLFHKWFEIPR